MADDPGKCLQQFNAQRGRSLLLAAVFLAFAGWLAFNGDRPVGIIRQAIIASAVLSAFFQLIPVIPGACRLEHCENGLVLRHYFNQLFLPWQAITEITVRDAGQGKRLAIYFDPTCFDPPLRCGPFVAVPFTYGMPADELAEKLTVARPQS